MKILFIGNQGNTQYRVAKWLKLRGHKVKLFLPRHAKNRSLPEWRDPYLKSNYPNWIKILDYNKIHNFIVPKEIKIESEKHDLIYTSGFETIMSLKLRKPVVMQPVGSDLATLPFDRSSLKRRMLSYIYRRRIKSVAAILTAMESVIWGAEKLGVKDKIISFPHLIDINLTRKRINKILLDEISEKYKKYNFVFLNLSRKNLNPNTLNYKGNEKVLKAFRRLLNDKLNVTVKLVAGMHGNDVGKFKRLVYQLDLEKHVDFIGHLPIDELSAYLSMDNALLFDKFPNYNRLNLSGIGKEALSLGCILITHVWKDDPLFEKSIGPGCPLLKAYSEAEIYNVMKELTSMNKNEIRKIRNESKIWAEKYLHWENNIYELEKILKKVIVNDKTQKSKR